jgi:hypothetical protein
MGPAGPPADRLTVLGVRTLSAKPQPSRQGPVVLRCNRDTAGEKPREGVAMLRDVREAHEPSGCAGAAV